MELVINGEIGCTFTKENKEKWKAHVERFVPEIIANLALKYQPQGKLSIGRSMKRW